MATHAEANAIIQNHQQNIEGATMYCLHFPCNECTKLIASSGIKEVVFLKMYRDQNPKAEIIFSHAGVKCRQMDIDANSAIETIQSILLSTKE